MLQLRAIAELQNGESEKALNDVKLSLRLADSVHTEPFLISHLVRIAILQMTLQPVYEGLAEHKWSDEQLACSMRNWRSWIFWRITSCPCAVKWDVKVATLIF